MATEDQIRDLYEKMAEEREALLATLDGMDDERAEVRPPEGEGEEGWSVKEQLSHLAQMEVSYRAWVERSLAEDRPDLTVGTVPDPIAIPLERAHEATVAEHVEELLRQRERTLEVMERITPEQYDRSGITGPFGELTVMQFLRSYYRHDRMHAAQISGRESDYKPRFLQGEPDQRIPR